MAFTTGTQVKVNVVDQPREGVRVCDIASGSYFLGRIGDSALVLWMKTRRECISIRNTGVNPNWDFNADADNMVHDFRAVDLVELTVRLRR